MVKKVLLRRPNQFQIKFSFITKNVKENFMFKKNKRFIIGPDSAISLSANGGTEVIAKYLVDKYNFRTLSLVKAKSYNKSKLCNSEVIFVGCPIYDYLFLSWKLRKNNVSINLLIVYGKKNLFTFIKELIIYISKFIFSTSIINLLGKQNTYLLKSNLRLNPYLIAERNIKNKFPNYHLNDFNKREFVFGYIGRICAKKGFYKALDLSEFITNNGYEILFDVLTLKEEGYLNQNSKVKMIFNNKKLNLPPKYNQIQYLILPYSSISSSICIPLVPLEAAIMGCRVILPKFMESLYLEIFSINVKLKDAFIFTEDYNLTIKQIIFEK